MSDPVKKTKKSSSKSGSKTTTPKKSTSSSRKGTPKGKSSRSSKNGTPKGGPSKTSTPKSKNRRPPSPAIQPVRSLGADARARLASWTDILLWPRFLAELQLENNALLAIRATCRECVSRDEVLLARLRLRTSHYDHFLTDGSPFLRRALMSAAKVNLSMSAISDVSMFANVHTLDLSSTPVADVTALGTGSRLNTVYLIGCKNLTDVSALANVRHVDLTRCVNLHNVSALGNVHTLDISFTPVADVSALGNVHTLRMIGCTNVTDVSALGNVHTLFMYGCTNIVDVSALGGNDSLSLYGCGRITSVASLANVRNLDLSFCNGVTDVSMLGKCEKLNLTGCKGVTDVSALCNVRWLDLTDCRRAVNLHKLTGVQRLELVGLPLTQEVIDALRVVPKLTV